MMPTQTYKPKTEAEFDREVLSIVNKAKRILKNNKYIYIDKDGNEFDIDFVDGTITVN